MMLRVRMGIAGQLASSSTRLCLDIEVFVLGIVDLKQEPLIMPVLPCFGCLVETCGAEGGATGGATCLRHCQWRGLPDTKELERKIENVRYSMSH